MENARIFAERINELGLRKAWINLLEEAPGPFLEKLSAFSYGELCHYVKETRKENKVEIVILFIPAFPNFSELGVQSKPPGNAGLDVT